MNNKKEELLALAGFAGVGMIAAGFGLAFGVFYGLLVVALAMAVIAVLVILEGCGII